MAKIIPVLPPLPINLRGGIPHRLRNELDAGIRLGLPFVIVDPKVVNLYSIGRAGLHKYNNQDHSLISGILAARNYLKLPGPPFRLWDINIDAEYQESAQRMYE